MRKKPSYITYEGFLVTTCWPTRTRTLNETTKMSCVTITPSAKTVNSGAKLIPGIGFVKLLVKKF